MTRELHHPPTRGVARLLALLVAAAVGCSSDTVAPPGPRPPSTVRMDRNTNWGQRGRLVKVSVARTYTKAEAARALLDRNPPAGALEAFDTVYNVVQYAIEYSTIDVHGNAATASAAVFVPDTTGLSLPLVSFSHGTQTDKQKVPSTPAFINPQGVINATHGSVTVLADYLGMGSDAGNPHPYLVPSADAAASLDALRAARRLVKGLGLRLDGRLFVYGYSEGGGIAMQLTRIIEEDPRSGFTVTAAAPMAGAYAIYEVSSRALANPTPVGKGATPIVYILASYQRVYGLAKDFSDLLVDPFDGYGQRLIDVGMPDEEATALFGSVFPRDVIQRPVRDAWVGDPDAPISRALRSNQTFDWAPRTPMRLYYGTLDVVVGPRNTIIADSVMRERGATSVEVVAFPGLTHGTAQWPSYISARRWFDTFPAPVDYADGDDPD